MRRVGTILLRNVKCETNGSLHVEWSNGHTHKYLPQWLLDHDPSCFHPTSLQRQKDSATLPRSAKTQQAHIENSGSSLRVEIDDGSKIVFDSEWLRTLSQKPAIPEKELWDSASFPSVVKCQASDLATKDEVLLNCLDSLYRYGIAVVSNTPSRSDEFEQLVRRIGAPRETLYGSIWDTAPKKSEMVNDTAYTKDGLHVHTDGCYLFDTPGLQLFNCTAQSPDAINSQGEIEGATKLVDAFKVLNDIRSEEPETFDFFLNTPLKWFHIENNVHVKTWERVIAVDPDGESLRQFRYNCYDLSPIDYLAEDEMESYYRHTEILNKYLRMKKYISFMKMNVGEMIIIDNHRVCHGRTAFTGFRNMMGCYMGRDDWLSRYRSLSGKFNLRND